MADKLYLLYDPDSGEANWGGSDVRIRRTIASTITFDNYGGGLVTLSGDTGGLTIQGGTAASNNLTLQSTSNATKGFVYVNSDQSISFDETNHTCIVANYSTPTVLGGASTRFELQSDGPGGLVITVFDAGNNPFYNGQRARGTHSAPTGVLAGDALMTFGGTGHDGTSLLTFSRASIRMFAAETWSSTANGTYLEIHTTTSGGTTQTGRYRIENNGNFIMLANYNIIPNTDSQGNVGVAANRFSGMVANTFAVYAAASDANATVSITTGSLVMGAGGASAADCRMRRTAATTITFDNNSTGGIDIVPATTNTGHLGTDALKWNRVRATSVVTGDLEMKDEDRNAHWVFREETDRIVVTNKITGKKYLLNLKEIA
jgi:hypothetical protein